MRCPLEVKSSSWMLLLLLGLALIAGGEGKHGHHHHPPRNRRHHHDSDFYETGAAKFSESERMDTMRRVQHSPHGHHHHSKNHHKQSEANLHQHFASEVQTYETKYETSYSYGDDYEDDVGFHPGAADGYGGYERPIQQRDHGKSIYDPLPADQDSMHNSQVSTKVVRPPKEQGVSYTLVPPPEKMKDGDTRKLAYSPEVVKPREDIYNRNLDADSKPRGSEKDLDVRKITRKPGHNSHVITPGEETFHRNLDVVVNKRKGEAKDANVRKITPKPEDISEVIISEEDNYQRNLDVVPKRRAKPVKSQTRKEVPLQRRVKISSPVSEKVEQKVQAPNLEKFDPADAMMNDAPAARTQNLISQAEETVPEGKTGGETKSRVQANGLVKKHRPKTLDPSGGGRWTLTYQGGPSEAALNNSLTNVTAQIGGAAFLPCRVGHLGDRQISWIRSRDWHVLTSGNDLYTADPRFSVLHEPGTQDWTLHIKYATPRDNGTYECQVSTGTGIISLFVNLRVVTPEAHIPGRGQYHVNRGSPIILTCVISKSPTPPHYVFWYHNGELLNFLRDRSDFTITLEPKMPLVELIDGGIDDGLVPATDDGTGVASVSRLQMNLAEDRHSGNYTCSAPKTKPASTLVFVTEGDKTAAVQRIDSSGAWAVCSSHTLILGLFAVHAWLSLPASFIGSSFYARFPFEISKKFCR